MYIKYINIYIKYIYIYILYIVIYKYMNIFQYILNVYKPKNLTFRLIFILIYSGSTVDYSGVCYLF